MALTKENKIEKIEIVGVYKAIQVKTATIVKEDGETISVSYDRKVLHPDFYRHPKRRRPVKYREKASLIS